MKYAKTLEYSRYDRRPQAVLVEKVQNTLKEEKIGTECDVSQSSNE